mmetsp:Transcript_35294/g.77102  ORF Transcript_35294/g.77102 Transcript_35294/m.77102 type:complete len:447 (-) Transcript_35294:27-1367(-)
MSVSDLRRLIQRATPRVEDVRSPDRTDIIRKTHGHLLLREVVDALDALDFAADAFLEQMKELKDAEGSVPDGGSELTAVHALWRLMDGLQTMLPAAPVAEEPGQAEDAAAEPGPGWQEEVSAARALGAERFKLKDFKGAAEAYAQGIRAAPQGHEDLAALYSNRSAALLQLGGREDLLGALSHARRCVELAPQWPKARFREGCSLRSLERFEEASRAFRAGESLEPSNKDWGREVEKTERLLRAQPPALLKQLVLSLLPELLCAWIRAGDSTGVLQVQVKGDLEELGEPKWQVLRERRPAAKATLRYAFLREKDYLANLAANLQSPPAQGVAVKDLGGKALSLPDISAFLKKSDSRVKVHLDIKQGGDSGHMAAFLISLPFDDEVVRFVAPCKDPAPPKCAVDGVLNAQRDSGFPKALPQYLGFQSFPGDLNFPVIDLARDLPSAS